ncbi:Ecd family [Dillenia turbinata]|uniref:Ecd family n=1 Tax=Dillenia turbinata TaxID=194707 RepID=A0AAN8UYQ8_9MAGN
MEAEPSSSFSSSSSSSIFSQKTRLPEDTVFFSIYPDFSLHKTLNSIELSSHLQSLHLQILSSLSPYTAHYIWQHEPFSLSPFLSPPLPHLHGKLRFGDNLDDEWFTVFLLFQISLQFPNLSIQVRDSDGEFLLIEAAFHLPRWLNPDNSLNRVFIRDGDIHIIPRKHFNSNPSLEDSLNYLIKSDGDSRASNSIQSAIKNRISEYPDSAKRNMHRVRARVPVSVAQLLKHEPCLISLAVEGFYDRDIDTMKYAAKMEKFLSGGGGEEMVVVSVTMSRAMYAQLMQQTFQAPRCYPMPARSNVKEYVEAELGMKIACGFEMMYQQRKREGSEGKGSTWDVFKESLEKSGYFEGLLPGSKEYRRRMETAEEYYRNSASFSRASEIMSAPVRRIDEILALPNCSADFKDQEIPPSDDDSWLYNGDDELNAAIMERQKEMELYESKLKKKQKSKEPSVSQSSGAELNDFNFGDIAKTMQDFVHKVSSYEGAEVAENRNLQGVDFDVDRFIKDMESAMQHPEHEGAADDDDTNEGSSSDMDFEESEDGSEFAEACEDNEDGEDAFMGSYSDALNKELKLTTLKKSFVRANDQSTNKNEGTSKAMEEDDNEELTPVDVDVNLVKSLLDSFSSQQGLPGPASNLLGLMGLQLPEDAKKGK